jgi:hypothetical protein
MNKLITLWIFIFFYLSDWLNELKWHNFYYQTPFYRCHGIELFFAENKFSKSGFLTSSIVHTSSRSAFLQKETSRILSNMEIVKISSNRLNKKILGRESYSLIK